MSIEKIMQDHTEALNRHSKALAEYCRAVNMVNGAISDVKLGLNVVEKADAALSKGERTVGANVAANTPTDSEMIDEVVKPGKPAGGATDTESLTTSSTERDPAETAEEPAKNLNRTNLNARLKILRDNHGKDVAKSVLAEFGCAKLSDIEETQFQEIWDRVTEIQDHAEAGKSAESVSVEGGDAPTDFVESPIAADTVEEPATPGTGKTVTKEEVRAALIKVRNHPDLGRDVTTDILKSAGVPDKMLKNADESHYEDLYEMATAQLKAVK